jgi:hypothetical protein
MELTNNPSISFVCNLYTIMNKNRIAFCNNEVYVEINTTDVEEFKKKALALGFAKLEHIWVAIDIGLLMQVLN